MKSKYASLIGLKQITVGIWKEEGRKKKKDPSLDSGSQDQPPDPVVSSRAPSRGGDSWGFLPYIRSTSFLPTKVRCPLL
uniref:Uncharacterized protein n=1 Tax=Mustela putorius furo TaxID=9669 RepID=M3XP10_MUSPF